MTEIIETPQVKEMLAVAAPFIKTVIETFIVPKLKSLKDRFILDVKVNYVPTEEHFSEYFFRTYKRVSVVNTLVFNNSQKFLKEIYIPLTIKKNDKREAKFKINGYPKNLIDKYERILITDSAGMGKSTLMKRIFIDAIDSRKGVPILIELRRLSKEKKLISEIQEQINALEKDFDPRLLLELMKEGGFVILLDGYDEISLADRETVTSDIQDFISKANNNKYILTSRPESALASFGDFQEFKIEPLKKKEAYELLRKYDKQGSVSSLLIKKLEETEMANVSEFLTNPLLVSLLFTAFQHKQAIPFKKYIFYRQVYDANFESHDLTKGDSYTHDKYTKLEIDDFHRVLRHIGFSCLKDNQRIEFSKDEILDLIRKSKIFCVGLDFSESDFLKDLLITVPLFSQDGNYYRWAHKSLQEYFAAQFIYLDLKEQQAKILRQIFNSQSMDKFINILDLYFDIDPKTFRSTILFDFLVLYKNHAETYSRLNNTSIDKTQVERRIETSFLRNPFVYIGDKSDDMDGPDVDDMIAIIRKSISGSERISGSLNSPNYDGVLYCLLNSDIKELLISFLDKKIPLLFTSSQVRRGDDIKLNIKHQLLVKYQPHFLNTNPEDEFNLPGNFADVNTLIEYTTLQGIRIINSEAMALLAQITRQIEIERTENFSLDTLSAS